MSAEFSFLKLVARNNLKISDAQANMMGRYVKQLSDWNRKINLVSRNDQEKIWSRHIVGSISFLFSFALREKSSVLDLGTGGGLPGIPLAILYPKNRFLLVDSIQKKIAAVKSIIEKLELPNVTAVCARAEELSKETKFRSAFDYVVSRAVASTADLIRWSRPFLPPPTLMSKEEPGKPSRRKIIPPPAIVLLKGGELSGELQQANIKMHPQSMLVHQIAVDGVDDDELFDKKLVIVHL